MSCTKALIAKHIPQILLIALLWITPASAQNLDIEHKENRESPGIESALLRVYQTWTSDRPALAKRTALQYSSHIKPTGKVVVILEPESNYDISQINIADLENLNAEILAQSKSLMRVAVPVSNLPRLTNIPGISFVRTPMKPQVNRVTSEGVGNTQANKIHSLGIRRSGVKVGIIMEPWILLKNQRPFSKTRPLLNISFTRLQNRVATVLPFGNHKTQGPQ